MFKHTMVVMAVLALVSVGLYAAAELVESLEYKFDAKESIEGWTANGDSNLEWKEGGAEKSAGCMKIAGDHASADGPTTRFKCGENVISFDYYVHGTSTCRVRFSAAGAENRTKYGRYGNLLIRKVEPDAWHHAEAKLIDLPGMAEGNKAKAFAELEFDRFGFCSIEKVEDGGYIMIDNVKMGKAGATAAPAE
jgi:hypothetical protein